MTTTDTKNYFYKLLNGKTSLWVVFWFWFIFITFLIEVFFETIFMDSVYAQNKDSYVELFIYVVITIYAIGIFLTIFRTANKYKGFKLWSFLSKVLVTINLFFSINFFIEVSKFYFYDDYSLVKEIESYKEQLPIQVDMNTALVDIYKNEHIIHYKYILNEVHLEDENLKNKFKKQIQDSLCEDQNSLDLLKRDYTLDYSYMDEKDNEILNIKTDKKVCGNSIYDLDILNDVLKKQGRI
jgi:hypothetical protein